ncbi:MAG: hypothetical protein IRZ15_02295 [Bryobacteraceae bacterium]|jgi:hypothetical protein|nr:hypothetical protein [Bryobacteraceae bacterium]
MRFDPADYGVEVEEILALDGRGTRLMPLARGQCSSREAWERLSCTTPERLFPKARDAKAAFSGLWLYFSCLEESHRVSQDTPSANGSFWHGIMHRQEPDPGNSAYWFRRVGRHPIFPELARAAAMLAEAVPGAGFRVRSDWDPFAFIDFCEMARRKPGSDAEKLALEIQRAEWQLLFHYCASPAPTGG